MCTIHAGSPQGALLRLNRLARLGVSGESEQHALIAEVIRLVVQMAWVGSAPRIVEIVRVQGWSEAQGFKLERLA